MSDESESTLAGRQAATSSNGLDYMSIKLLADTERAITGDRKD